MPYQNLIFSCLGVGLLILVIKFGDRRGKYLRKHGIPSTAKIIGIEKTLITIGESSRWSPIMKIVLGIKFDGVEYRQVTIKQDFLAWAIPKAGDKVNVLIDPRNPDNVLIVDIAQD